MRVLQPGNPAFYEGTRAVRIAPARGEKPAASFWKFWREKDEIYAANRMGGHSTKISVHASGQIHMHRGARNIQQFSAPMVLAGGEWSHALEVRFLLGARADLPPKKLLQLKKKDKGLLVNVPDGHVFYLNLLVSAVSTPPATLPAEFIGAPELWRTTLTDGRVAALLGRVMPFDDQSSTALHYIRMELQPKVSFSGPADAEPPYIEVMHAFWSEAGNVLLVVPMGPEGRRRDPEPSSAGIDERADSRKVLVDCSNTVTELMAPDGSVIGSLSIAGGLAPITLVKDREIVHTIGRVTLSISPASLRWGESFVRPSVELATSLIVGGAQPRAWTYSYEVSLKGSQLALNMGPSSSALRNANLPTPIPSLGPREEIVLRSPAEKLLLHASKDVATASADLVCSFRLRDI